MYHVSQPYWILIWLRISKLYIFPHWICHNLSTIFLPLNIIFLEFSHHTRNNLFCIWNLSSYKVVILTKVVYIYFKSDLTFLNHHFSVHNLLKSINIWELYVVQNFHNQLFIELYKMLVNFLFKLLLKCLVHTKL